MKKNILMSCALIAAIGVTSLDAANIRYRLSGNWTAFTPDNSSNGWQSTAVPTIDDAARINWGGNTVTVNTSVSAGNVQIAVDETGTLTIESGGILTADSSGALQGRIIVGNNSNAAAVGTLNVDSGGSAFSTDLTWIGLGTTGIANVSGVLDVTSHLWIGWNAGVSGTLNIEDGGIVNVGGNIGLDFQNVGAAGFVNIADGGQLNLSQLSTAAFHGTSKLIGNLGATVSISGNELVDFNALIDSGYIEASSGFWDVSFDGVTTTAIVVPEPSTAALLAGMSAIALLGLRRRRS